MYEEERDGGKMRKYKRKERQRKRKWTLCNHPSSQISFKIYLSPIWSSDGSF